MKNKFSERLIKAMDIRNLKPADLSKLTGIDKSAISCYRNGKYRAGQYNLYLLSEALNVEPAWLMGSNIVPMEPSEMKAHSFDDANEYLLEVLNINDFETAMVQRYRKADSKIKKAIDTLLGLDEMFTEEQIGEENE